VEVSTDGGKNWKAAEIRGTAYRMAHTKFTYNWNWDGTETELLSRCTDEIGQVQPTRAQVAKFFNAHEDHSFNVPGNDNSIQPWRVARDGSVHNAIA
jgi:sulfane dehydrogenase subunit SoxC